MPRESSEAQAGRASPAPPQAPARPHRLETHGIVRIDEYHWMRNRDDPEVLEYLAAENEYAASVMAGTEALRETLFREMKGRIAETDESVPYRVGDYLYFRRFEAGRDYPVHLRRRDREGAPEEVVLDVNELAGGHGFFAARVEPSAIAPETDILAVAVDTAGRRRWEIRFLDLSTGEFLPDVVNDAAADVAWASDGRTLFYTKKDPVTLRWSRILRHRLGTDPASDPLVFEEADETFGCRVGRTSSRRYLTLVSWQTLATEVHLVPADAPDAAPVVFLPRRCRHEYAVDHVGDDFYVLTNEDAPNFRLVRARAPGTPIAVCEEVVGHREDVLLEAFTPFEDYLALTEREGGVRRLRVLPRHGGQDHVIPIDEAAHTVSPTHNLDPGTSVLRFSCTSLRMPLTVYDYDMRARRKTLRKREEVPGGFDVEDYETERLEAPARDGERIPVDLVRRRGETGTPGPLLLAGYGAYGICLDPEFSASRLSLLDRGFTFGIAHVRGGEEMGRRWTEAGRGLRKMNTFTDFIDAAEFLVRCGRAAADGLFAIGGSAGGLLMGAVVNLRPDLFRGVLAAVPFVDVLTTMLDPDIPLTTGEYDEWGDPRERESFDYIRAYSPYDHVEAKAYPHLLVTTGLHDSQVQFWEPAKWVARLRARRTDDRRLLLKTNMEAGHGGASGRYERLRERAYEFAFLLDVAGQASG